MNYWAGINLPADQEVIRQGAENLINVARDTQNAGRRDNLRIEGLGSDQNARTGAAGGAQDPVAGNDDAASQ
jgi:hypothetical protein